MRSIQLIAFSVALFSPALAVPCHEIGIAGEGNGYDDDGRRYNNMVQPPEGITIKPFKYDPFQEDAPFERYDTKDCLVRFQNPNHGALSSITDYVGKLAAGKSWAFRAKLPPSILTRSSKPGSQTLYGKQLQAPFLIPSRSTLVPLTILNCGCSKCVGCLAIPQSTFENVCSALNARERGFGRSQSLF